MRRRGGPHPPRKALRQFDGKDDFGLGDLEPFRLLRRHVDIAPALPLGDVELPGKLPRSVRWRLAFLEQFHRPVDAARILTRVGS